MRFLTVFIGFLLLSGCMMTAEQQVAADDKQCQSYGVVLGSPPYVDCRMRLDQQHANARLLNSTSPVGFVVNTVSGH